MLIVVGIKLTFMVEEDTPPAFVKDFYRLVTSVICIVVILFD